MWHKAPLVGTSITQPSCKGRELRHELLQTLSDSVLVVVEAQHVSAKRSQITGVGECIEQRMVGCSGLVVTVRLQSYDGVASGAPDREDGRRTR